MKKLSLIEIAITLVKLVMEKEILLIIIANDVEKVLYIFILKILIL